MFKRIYEINVYILLTLLFSLSLFFINRASTASLNKDLQYHSHALSSYLWELNYAGAGQYLSLALNSRDYASAAIFDYAGKDWKVSEKGPELPPREQFLVRHRLIPVKDQKVVITWEEQPLGELFIQYYNRNIYLYSYALVIFLMTVFISYLMIRLIRSREWLENRVNQRTQELKEEVQHRKSVEDDLKMTLNSIDDGLIATNEQRRITRMNPVAETLTGWSESEALNQEFVKVFKMYSRANEKEAIDPVSLILDQGKIITNQAQGVLMSRTGDKYQIDISGAPLLNEDNRSKGTVLVFRDVTEDVHLRSQLEHSHRMDAIGQLAGGVAHDFNNMLGGIIGSAELLRNHIIEGNEADRMLDLIIETSDRASALTGQLLTYSRKNKIISTHIDLHKLINDALSLLSRSIDKSVKIDTLLKADQFTLAGDPSMIQNSIINLGINASHAMPEGGTLHLETRNLFLDEEYCEKSSFNLEPGDYLELVIEDNGTGIEPDHLSHIFEPFFTTKGLGKGTGLGLAAVYGTVTQHYGEIKVYSEQGRGTSFHILLPVSSSEGSRTSPQPFIPEKGKGTLLVVDDEKVMRITARGILEDLGYTVLLAQDGQEALETYKKHREDISLVLLDMVMPHMSGKECFKNLRALNPDLPIILSSGFTNSDDINNMKKMERTAFIMKPYRAYDLSKLVKETLHS